MGSHSGWQYMIQMVVEHQGYHGAWAIRIALWQHDIGVASRALEAFNESPILMKA